MRDLLAKMNIKCKLSHYFQCWFISETQLLMEVFYIWIFLSRNHFLKGYSIFWWRGDLFLGGGNPIRNTSYRVPMPPRISSFFFLSPWFSFLFPKKYQSLLESPRLFFFWQLLQFFNCHLKLFCELSMLDECKWNVKF